MKVEFILPLDEVVRAVAGSLARFKPRTRVRVTIDSDIRKRTLEQNARLWSMFDHLGWEKGEAHDFFCRKFLPPIVKELPDGTQVEIMRGTSFLTTKEMSDFQDAIERFLAQHGLW